MKLEKTLKYIEIDTGVVVFCGGGI